MSDNTEFPVELIAIGTVVRPHPSIKGETQIIYPNTRFSVADEATLERLTSREGRALPAARVWSEDEVAAPAVAEGDTTLTQVIDSANKAEGEGEGEGEEDLTTFE